MVVFKQEGLNERVQYDKFPRHSLIDHFFAMDTTREQFENQTAVEVGDFIHQDYEAVIRRKQDRVQVMMTGSGLVEGIPLQMTKGITMEAGSSTLEVAYMIEGLPQDRTFHFGVEFNLAGLPQQADDRYFFSGNGTRLGHLGQRLELQNERELGLCDEWLGVRLQLLSDAQANFWTYPVETVSQSEGGFELVHQAVCVVPHWFVQGDSQGRWSVTLRLDIDTTLAESRMEKSTTLVAS